MTDGRLALVFDDGYAEDYDDLYPVLRERDAPASLAIVPDWLDDPDHLTTEQLAELADAGWEVVAHGRRHRYMQAHRFARDAFAGDERLSLDSDHVFPGEDHGLYPGDEFEVTDGTRTETHVLAEKIGGDNPAVSLEEPLGADFAAVDSVFRPSEAQLRDEAVAVTADFADLGYDPTTFVLPYDAGDARVWSLVGEHYDALANAAVGSLPNPPGTAPLGLQRYYLQTTHMTTAEIGSYLDAVADSGGLGILSGHSAWESVTPERVAAVVDAAHDRGIEVTTVADAVR